MKSFTVKILTLICIVSVCFALTACGRKTKLDDLVEEGYYVSVKYDPNGGKFSNGENSALVDYYKPDDYTADDSGKITVKLVDPDADIRWSGYLTKNPNATRDGYFCVGWYKNRTLVKDADGNPVSETGEKLYYDENTQKYYAVKDKDKEEKTAVTPMYTYSDRWDFNTDTFSFNKSDASYTNIKSGKDLQPLMTLYAAWLPNFSFEYYVKNDNGEWVNTGETTFNYMTVQKERAKYSEESIFDDTIVMPCFETKAGVPDGKMIYSYFLSDQKTGYSYSYSFTEQKGMSFAAAYLTQEDADKKTNNLVDSVFSETGLGYLLKHDGTVNLENATAENSVKKVYVEYKDGCEYYIGSDTKDWAVNFREYLKNDPNGTFYIKSDLDFSGEKSGSKWVNSISTGTFNGVMQGYNGETHAIKNAAVELGVTNAGGLFGTIGKDAVVKDLSFENVTVDIAFKSGAITNGKYGLFAGVVETGATIENVSVSGTLKVLGTTPLLTKDRMNDAGTAVVKQKNAVINLVANAETEEVTPDLLNKIDNKGVNVVLYALKVGSGKYVKYQYLIKLLTDDDKNVIGLAAKIENGYVYYETNALNVTLEKEEDIANYAEFTLTAE